MKLDELVQVLSGLPSLEEQRKMAGQLLDVVLPDLPDGQLNPMIDGRFTEVYDDNTREALEDARRNYSALSLILGNDVPTEIVKSHRTFERNASHAVDLMRVHPKDRASIPAHELFPYWPDLNKALHNAELNYSDIDFSRVTVEEDVRGRGSFGSVYFAKGPEGKKFAVKIYHDPDSTQDSNQKRSQMRELNDRIYYNLLRRRALWKQKPFADTLALSLQNGNSTFFNVKRYLRGETAESQIFKGNLTERDKAVLLTSYAGMLDLLHQQNLVFIDNNWNAVMYDGKKATVFDYDLVSPESNSGIFAGVASSSYCSQEQITGSAQTKLGDLEAFAKMIHVLYAGTKFHPDTDSNENRAAALTDSREYPGQFTRMLPGNLAEVVIPVLEYPRDKSITSSDFADAINSTYKSLI